MFSNKNINHSSLAKLSILAAFVVLVIFISATSVNFYVKYQEKKVERIIQDRQTQELFAKQQKTLEETQKEIENLKTQKSQEIEKAISELKEAQKKADARIPSVYEQYKNQEGIFKPLPLATIVEQWRPFIARIRCGWETTDGDYIWGGGSGLFYPGILYVLTNRHVVELQDEPATLCIVTLPEDPKTEIVVMREDLRAIGNDQDAAVLLIKNPSQYAKNEPEKVLSTCIIEAKIGDQVVILGYPGIGSNEDITATEGIISGYEWPYYVTSAKIEKGNSGGVAILVRGNCNLGIPTLVAVGELESLGRILDWKAALIR